MRRFARPATHSHGQYTWTLPGWAKDATVGTPAVTWQRCGIAVQAAGGNPQKFQDFSSHATLDLRSSKPWGSPISRRWECVNSVRHQLTPIEASLHVGGVDMPCSFTWLLTVTLEIKLKQGYSLAAWIRCISLGLDLRLATAQVPAGAVWLLAACHNYQERKDTVGFPLPVSRSRRARTQERHSNNPEHKPFSI
jgi:hypothetical protein